jgi:hypothetical protein
VFRVAHCLSHWGALVPARRLGLADQTILATANLLEIEIRQWPRRRGEVERLNPAAEPVFRGAMSNADKPLVAVLLGGFDDLDEYLIATEERQRER